MPTPPGSPKSGRKVDEQNVEQGSQPTEQPSPQQNAQPRNIGTLFGFTPRNRTYICQEGHLHVVNMSLTDNVLQISDIAFASNDPRFQLALALGAMADALGLGDDSDEELDAANEDEKVAQPEQTVETQESKETEEELQEDSVEDELESSRSLRP